MNRSRRIAATCGVQTFLGAFPLLAAPVAAPLPSTAVSFGAMLQVVFGLAVVLGTVAAAAWLLKRFAPGQVSAGGALRLVGGIAVGPKERVVVVEVGDTWLVVGVAPGQVNALHHMPKVVAAQETADVVAGDQRFSVWLKDVMSRRNGAGK